MKAKPTCNRASLPSRNKLCAIRMKKGHLSDYFEGVAVKELSLVETNSLRSHQHEFHANRELITLLGRCEDTEKRFLPSTFLYLNDDENARIAVEGELTWYDARAKARIERGINRSEYRLYFPSNEVIKRMNAGDLFFLAKRSKGRWLVLIVERNTSMAQQLLWLFGMDERPQFSMIIQESDAMDSRPLEYSTSFILNKLGIEVTVTDNHLQEMLTLFGSQFPPTKEFSEFCRSKCKHISPIDSPSDEVLTAWMLQEEQMFLTLEKHILQERISQGFASVEDFIQTSLSAQNRRKSRAGAALENHVECILNARRIPHAWGANTEGKSKPDFLFPGSKEYHDPAFPATSLHMLGVKSTCKDRWRQVLAEADKIKIKHLLTLEPGISQDQTDEMKIKNLQLVIPAGLHDSYSHSQRNWLLTLDDFLAIVQIV